MKHELPAMIALADRLLATDTAGTLATLFSARGSTYRPLGSMMVSLPGMHAGGISGGCLEEYVARAGETATRNTPAVMLHFDTHPDADGAVPALGCGGTLSLLVERLTSEHLRLLEQLAAAHERDDHSVLACIVKRMGRSLSVSRKWFDAFDTETAATQELARICIKSLHDARSSQVSIDEDTNVLVQYVPSLTRLVIFGAGDDARPLCTLGAQLGWHVSVADRRARLATAERFPDADAVLAAEWDDAVDRVRFSSRTAVVLMTHSLEDDARVLSLLPSRHIAYLGALGPAHRREWLLAEAATLRGSVQTEIASRLKGPIGFDLGDRSPAGIAVAVTAEILADLNSRSGHPLHQTTPLSTTESRPGMCVVAM